MTDSPTTTGLVTPDEAVFVRYWIGNNPRGVDLHAMAERLGCAPDLASVVDALEEVARGE